MIQTDQQDIDSPTVRQIRIAFEQTPNKLRLVEQGWRERRRQEINRKPIQQDGRGVSGVDKVGDQVQRAGVGKAARNRKRPTEATPSLARHETAPPTPPPTPPAQDKSICTKKDRKADTPINMPRPVLVHPLPPTPTPMILGHKTTLIIPDQSPSCPHECVLRIGRLRISVMRGGEMIEVASATQVSRMRLAEHKEWSQTERKQWETVWDLLEQAKRKTPRIKIYHPSALITITCSTPPDVILSLITPVKSPKERKHSGQPVVKVKLVYSPGQNKLVIDTSESCKVKAEPTFRTRRCIPLPASHLHDMRARMPITLARGGLGIRAGEDWIKAEVEAVDRFWALREEWLR